MKFSFENINENINFENQKLIDKINTYHNYLFEEKGDMLGWVNYPNSSDEEEINKIKEIALNVRKNSQVFLVVGIGGSYLGAKAVLEFLENKESFPVKFIGTSFSARQINEVLDYCKDKDVTVNVISKSGSTTEIMIALNIVEKFLKDKYQEKFNEHIIVTTDKENGFLLNYAREVGATTLSIPRNIGGRFSVMTSVGILPFAVAGIDVDRILEGVKKAQKDFKQCDINKNYAYQYAVLRNRLFESGYCVELLTSFDPYLESFGKWWQQLFAESEGKDSKGIFVCPLTYSTDLHSVGQFVQEGSKNLIETFIFQEEEREDIDINVSKSFKNIEYLNGKSMNFVNKCAYFGTKKAHIDANVPIFEIVVDRLDEFNLGYLFYFFELSCAMSGMLLGVNPFNQPGVEEYKKNMKALLGN